MKLYGVKFYSVERRYLRTIQQYCEQVCLIYYLDKTWVNVGNCANKVWIDSKITSHCDVFLKGLTTGAPNPSGKDKCIIVLYLGSEDGIVPGGLCIELKKITKLS